MDTKCQIDRPKVYDFLRYIPFYEKTLIIYFLVFKILTQQYCMYSVTQMQVS